jgi:hypothetical protein
MERGNKLRGGLSKTMHHPALLDLKQSIAHKTTMALLLALELLHDTLHGLVWEEPTYPSLPPQSLVPSYKHFNQPNPC